MLKLLKDLTKVTLLKLLLHDEQEELKGLIGTIGENMKIVKAYRWESAGAVSTYLHAGGSIGVLVDVEGEYDDALLRDLCMHIAAMSPTYVAPEDVPADDVAKEKAVAAEKHQGKPENIIDKILTGHINKWYTEICLTKQSWFKDDKVHSRANCSEAYSQTLRPIAGRLII